MATTWRLGDQPPPKHPSDDARVIKTASTRFDTPVPMAMQPHGAPVREPKSRGGN